MPVIDLDTTLVSNYIDNLKQNFAVISGKAQGAWQENFGDTVLVVDAIQENEGKLFDLFTGAGEFQIFLSDRKITKKEDLFEAIYAFIEEDFKRVNTNTDLRTRTVGIGPTVFERLTFDNDQEGVSQMILKDKISILGIITQLFIWNDKCQGQEQEQDTGFNVSILRATVFVYEIIFSWPDRNSINPDYTRTNMYTRDEIDNIIETGNIVTRSFPTCSNLLLSQLPKDGYATLIPAPWNYGDYGGEEGEGEGEGEEGEGAGEGEGKGEGKKRKRNGFGGSKRKQTKRKHHKKIGGKKSKKQRRSKRRSNKRKTKR